MRGAWRDHLELGETRMSWDYEKRDLRRTPKGQCDDLPRKKKLRRFPKGPSVDRQRFGGKLMMEHGTGRGCAARRRRYTQKSAPLKNKNVCVDEINMRFGGHHTFFRRHFGLLSHWPCPINQHEGIRLSGNHFLTQRGLRRGRQETRTMKKG